MGLDDARVHLFGLLLVGRNLDKLEQQAKDSPRAAVLPFSSARLGLIGAPERVASRRHESIDWS